MVAVPREWPGSTVVCVATGPSLTVEDVESCRGRARVIAINDAYRVAPWADALYACDAKWWHWHKGVPEFTGPKWSMEHSCWFKHRAVYRDVQLLRNTGPAGLEHQPTGLRNGRNSGYQAINLAVHYGASRILLIGYDMQRAKDGRNHFFGEHPNQQRSPYSEFRRRFVSIVKPLRKRGITVLNCSRSTVLECFEKRPLAEALAESSEAVAC